jgi:hypothetical protein
MEGENEIPDGLRFLGEREMSSLGARIPALRRRGAKTNTIRQHYYPEGGWGWVVVSCALFIHVLCAGAQLSCALLFFQQSKMPFRASSFSYADTGKYLDICSRNNNSINIRNDSSLCAAAVASLLLQCGYPLSVCQQVCS